MAKRTKKVGSAGRMGARYGIRIRKAIANIEVKQKAAHPCPSCGDQKVFRLSTGIWKCNKCGKQYAGGAYQPHTEAGLGVMKEEKETK